MARSVYLVGAFIVVVLLIATWPHVFGLNRTMVIAQLTALRGLLVVTGAAGALLATLLCPGLAV